MRSAFMTACILLWPMAATQSRADEYCGLQSRLAEKTMEARQYGVTLARMLEINKQMAEKGESQELADSVTLFAYDEQLVTGEDAKSSAIKEFGNRIMLLCVTGKLPGQIGQTE